MDLEDYIYGPKKRTFSSIVYRPGKIARITLNRPESLNSMTAELLAELRDALIIAERDPEVRVILINGEGRAFSTGYALGTYYKTAAQKPPIIVDKDHIVFRHEIYFTIWNLLKPVIAQVHGYCLAGASELISVCDIVVTADDATFGYPPVRAMSTPDTPYPAWLMNIRKAKLYCFTGDPITGKEAVEWGLATISVPADRLEEETTKLAERVALMPTDLMSLQKEEINRIYDLMGFRTSIEWSSKIHDLAGKTASAIEFRRLTKEKGVKEATSWRDAPYGDNYRKPKKG